MTAQRRGLEAMFGGAAPLQLEDRTVSIYNKIPQSQNWRKGMEIIDSTDVNEYVHISRSTPLNESVLNNPPARTFDDARDPTRRTITALGGGGGHVGLGSYTRANNAHITLEGRYAYVMQQFTNGFADLNGIKSGAPVVPGFANLNFGSLADHGGVAMSANLPTFYINDFAQQAKNLLAARPEDWVGQNAELDTEIDGVRDQTRALANHFLQNSPLQNLPGGDFGHYNGATWANL